MYPKPAWWGFKGGKENIQAMLQSFLPDSVIRGRFKEGIVDQRACRDKESVVGTTWSSVPGEVQSQD